VDPGQRWCVRRIHNPSGAVTMHLMQLYCIA
jgi:hypothetical protein